jgi:hypothetical protein
MITKIAHSIAIAIACLCTAQIARCQTPALTLTAEAQLLNDNNETKAFLTIHVINSTDHEVTVLTKNLNTTVETNGNQVSISLGYSDPAITHDGHAVIASLYDFSPVTLRPHEEALVRTEINRLSLVVPDTQFVVRYAISPEWAARFALWSGSVESKAFSPRVRQQAHPKS